MTQLRLKNEHINTVREEIEAFLKKTGSDQMEVLRSSMTLEEILLNYQDELGEDTRFSYKLHKHLGQPRIELTVFDQSMYPFPEGEDDENRFILNRLMADLGTTPNWQYRNGRNVITFMPVKQRSTQAMVLITMLLSVLCGLGCRLFAPELGATLYDGLLSPIFDALMGLLSTISGPMIFPSICWGIFSIGDTATLNRIGKRMIRRRPDLPAVRYGPSLLPLWDAGRGSSPAEPLTESKKKDTTFVMSFFASGIRC